MKDMAAKDISLTKRSLHLIEGSNLKMKLDRCPQLIRD